MKIRSDFVTNSSSSSFVIGKKDEDITINTVYSFIREQFATYVAKRELVIDYIKNHPELKIKLVNYDGHVGFSFMDFWDLDDKKRTAFGHKIIKELKLNGLSNYRDVFYDFEVPVYNSEWIEKCKTYDEYVNYWLETYKKDSDRQNHAPFSIGDFTKTDDIYFLHYGSTEAEKHIVDYSSDIVSWYFDSIDIFFNDGEFDDYSDKNFRKRVEKDIAKLGKMEFRKDHACEDLLGKICVYSECGFIPEPIVNNIAKRSTYHCNHMG